MREHNNIQSTTDCQLYESDKINNIVTFNGQGCSGKTTQSKLLAESNEGKYRRIYSYKLREDFEEKVYESLNRKNTCIKYSDPNVPDQTLYMVEVLGIPTLAWLTAHFYKEVKPLMLKGSIVVLDHYIGDFYADMLADVNIEDFRSFVRKHLAIPDFNQGTHFYLDIDDHKIYQERWCKREEQKKPEERRDPPVCKALFEERRERYLKLCEKTPMKCINATGCQHEIAKEVQGILKDRF